MPKSNKKDRTSTNVNVPGHNGSDQVVSVPHVSSNSNVIPNDNNSNNAVELENKNPSNDINAMSGNTNFSLNPVSNNTPNIMEMMSALIQSQQQTLNSIKTELQVTMESKMENMVNTLFTKLTQQIINNSQVQQSTPGQSVTTVVPDSDLGFSAGIRTPSPRRLNINASDNVTAIKVPKPIVQSNSVNSSSMSPSKSGHTSHPVLANNASHNMFSPVDELNGQVPQLENIPTVKTQVKFDDEAKQSSNNSIYVNSRISNITQTTGDHCVLSHQDSALATPAGHNIPVTDRSTIGSDSETELLTNTDTVRSNSSPQIIRSDGPKFNGPAPYSMKYTDPEKVYLCRGETPSFTDMQTWTLRIKDGMESIQTWLPLLLPIPDCYREFCNINYMITDERALQSNYLASQRAAWKWIMSGLSQVLNHQINTDFEKKAVSENILGPEKLNFNYNYDRKYFKNCYNLIEHIKKRYGRAPDSLVDDWHQKLQNLSYNDKKGISGLFNDYRLYNSQLETYGEGYRSISLKMQITALMRKLPSHMRDKCEATVISENRKGTYKSLDELENYLLQNFESEGKPTRKSQQIEGKPKNKQDDNVHALQEDQTSDNKNNHQGNKFRKNKKKFNNQNNNQNNNHYHQNNSTSRNSTGTTNVITTGPVLYDLNGNENAQVMECSPVNTSSSTGVWQNPLGCHSICYTGNEVISVTEAITVTEVTPALNMSVRELRNTNTLKKIKALVAHIHSLVDVTDDNSRHDDLMSDELIPDYSDDDVQYIDALIAEVLDYTFKVMIDSGASIHCSPHLQYLVDQREAVPMNINTVNSTLKNAGHVVGTLQISDLHKLSDVRHIPGSKFNIASVSKICEGGTHMVVFDEHQCWIIRKKGVEIDPAQVIMKGDKSPTGLYFLKGSILDKSKQDELKKASNDVKTLHFSKRKVPNDTSSVKPTSDPNKGYSAQARKELNDQRKSLSPQSPQNENKAPDIKPVTQIAIPKTIPNRTIPSLKEKYNIKITDKKSIPAKGSGTQSAFEAYPDFYSSEVNALESICVMSADFLNSDSPSNTEILSSESESMESLPSNIQLYHNRLAHPGGDTLIKANKVYQLGLDGKQLEEFNSHSCKTCQLCKAKRAPINHAHPQRTPIATRVMGCWHADLMGPISSIQEGRRIHNRTLNKESYLLVIVDEFSRYYMVIPLQHKSDAEQAIIEQINLMENVTSQKLQSIHTDGGGEFTSHSLEKYFREKGIFHTVTIPDTPQLNGIVERANQTLSITARCMLSHADGPQELWDCAYLYAAQIHNLLPVKKINYAIPAEVFLGEEQTRLTLKHLKVFGCDAYVKLDKDHAGKLQPAAKPYIHVGFSPKYSAYKLLNPDTLEVIIDRNVTFDEVSFVSLIQSKEVITEKVENLKDDTNQEWEVENIIAREVDNKGKKMYCVLWKGYQKPTWEPEKNLTHCKELLSRFDLLLKRARKGNLNVLQEATILAAAGKKTSDRGYKIPQHYHEAIRHPDSVKWIQAIHAELDALKEQSVFIPSTVPVGRKQIGCRWVFDVKRDATGTIIKFKARLVIQGFSQEFGVDYSDTFSPTVKIKSIKFLLAIATQEDLEIQQLDFKTAFLNASLDEEIYMKFPQGYDKPSGEYNCLKLDKALYGLKQAPRAWWLQLDQFLNELGYRATPLDECLYFKKVNDKYVYLTIYVDDTLAFYHKSIEHIWLKDKQHIINRYKIDDIGEAKWILKMEIIRDRKNNTLRLSQSNYIQAIFQNLTGIDPEELKPSGHPFKYEDLSVIPEKVNPKLSELLNESQHTLYRSIVGSLLYAANITRIDLSFIVGHLARYCTKPTQYHLEAAKQALRYVHATTDLQLEFHKAENLEVIIYTDSSWGDNRDDRKGTGGHVTMFNNRPVAWQSKKHSTTPLSSTEAEYYALANAVREAIFIKQWFKIYRENDIKLRILCDNLGAIAMSDHSTDHNRTKHIDIQYYFIREHIRKKDMTVEYIDTNNQLADVLTKSFKNHPNKFTGLVNRLLTKQLE